MPKEVAEAINAVMSKIKTLGKDGTNSHQKYNFVSTDKFFEAIGPLEAEAGIIILQDEDSVVVETVEVADDYGKTKSRSWLTARYLFTLVHKSGALYGPMKRSVMVQANGAQAFGSAQSYALKQFMRSLYQIPTGDADDADNNAADNLPNTKPPAKPPVTVAKNPEPPVEQEVIECKRIAAALKAAKTFEEVDNVMADPFVGMLRGVAEFPGATLQQERIAKLDALAKQRIEIINDTPLSP